ncbi:MAG: phosphatidylglycerol lysyltransferase domain-containing protein [Desulfobacterales bacterium]|jgi:hypothetical protein|nr:phosphatidylglycerol lysyltransferase domain-containing protein [Desulfobacterales bacterium]
MPLTFSPVSDQGNFDLQHDYRKILSACPQIASDYSFINIWGWAEAYGLEWAWGKEFVWLRQTLPETRYWAPIGPWDKVANWYATLSALFPNGADFTRVPDQLLNIWTRTFGLQLEIGEARGHWDYIYSVPDLVALKGNRFHKKKNLLNQFIKKFDYSFSAFDSALVTQALSMQTDWCEWRDCESSETLAAENRAIERILTHWDALNGLIGGAIVIDTKLAAYTVAEPLTETSVVIHFEKGSPDITGIYQAINQMFLKSQGNRFLTVNREQDIDDPGLRKAKLSYHPSEYLKKYSVRIR